MTRRVKPVVLAIVSDVHAGSSVAVCPPSITLDDGGRYEASPAQRWLWDNWLAYWARVEAVRKEHTASLYVVFNGDLVDGNHHGTTQIMSGNPGVQASVARDCLAVPLALKPDRVWMIRGTDVHVGQSGTTEEGIAASMARDGIPIVRDTARDTASHWHAKLDVQGVRFDFAHHGRVGTRPWTKPNVTANLAAEIFYDHAASGQLHPHLAVRSHMHQWVDTHDMHPVRVIQTAAWQLATSFIHRIAPGKLADVGGVIATVDGGVLSVEKVKFTPDPVATWQG